MASTPAAAQRSSHALLGELGGSGGFLSANYERSLRPLAVRVGGGYMLFIGPAFNTTAALRFGRRGQMEVGGGVLVAPSAPESASSSRPVQSVAMATGLLAYRWDVGNGGRFARVAFTPILNGEGQVIPWGGVALGIRLR